MLAFFIYFYPKYFAVPRKTRLKTSFLLSQYGESQTVPTCLNCEINLQALPADRVMGLKVTRKADGVRRLDTIFFMAWNRIPSAPTLKHSFIPVTQVQSLLPIPPLTDKC